MNFALAVLNSALWLFYLTLAAPASHGVVVCVQSVPIMRDDTQKFTTLIGCIAKKDGRAVLVNKKFPDGLELRMAQDIQKHAGLQARVVGAITTRSGEVVTDKGRSNALRSKTTSDGLFMQVDHMTFMDGGCPTTGAALK